MANRGKQRGIGSLCVCLAALCVGCSGGQTPAPAGAGKSMETVAGQPKKPPSEQPGREQTAPVDSQPGEAGGPAAAPASPPSIPKVF